MALVIIYWLKPNYFSVRGWGPHQLLFNLNFLLTPHSTLRTPHLQSGHISLQY